MKSRSVFSVILNMTDALVIRILEIADHMPIGVSGNCRTLLSRDHLCDTCCAQFRSTPKYGHIARLPASLGPSRKATCEDILWRVACTSVGHLVFVEVVLAKWRAPEKRDYVREYRKLVALSLILAASVLAHPGSALGQANGLSEGGNICFVKAKQGMVCQEPKADQAAEAALRLASLRYRLGARQVAPRNAIVIGFVGGFVRSDDGTHPEVLFAALLRQAYPSIHAEIFANHDGKDALQRVLHLLDTNRDGVLTTGEKEQASIIVYGHSWGASQAVTLARELGRRDIPVSLTILVDSVHKPGHDDGMIPPNVRNAVNFYQTRGFIHGRSRFRAADPERTRIIGNFQMTYQDRQINCDNYPWIARHLNRGHHEIENDPRVWEGISSFIDSELLGGASQLQASLPAPSQSLK